jgi:hypothetical protein
MSRARIPLLTCVLLATACTMPAKRADEPAQEQKALGERIEKICTLPEPERSAQIEKLKNESGMVLYCGK